MSSSGEDALSRFWERGLVRYPVFFLYDHTIYTYFSVMLLFLAANFCYIYPYGRN